jgi:hypothetical protein
MNLQPHNTRAHSAIPQSFLIASTKLRSSRRQKSTILDFRLGNPSDSSLPAPPGARLTQRPASPDEISKKASQLERVWTAGGLIDDSADIGWPSRAHFYCFRCRHPVAECTCEKPAAANAEDNAAPAEPETPHARRRRKQREFRAKRRQLRQSMEGKVP